MNEGKLEVVKQEMARVNINILDYGSDRVPEELWIEVPDQDHSQEKEMQQSKMAV